MQVQGMDQNSFFLNAINHEAIKSGVTPTIRIAFLVIESCQKLPRPSFKSYVNNISLSLFLEVKISIGQKFCIDILKY